MTAREAFFVICAMTVGIVLGSLLTKWDDRDALRIYKSGMGVELDGNYYTTPGTWTPATGGPSTTVEGGSNER